MEPLARQGRCGGDRGGCVDEALHAWFVFGGGEDTVDAGKDGWADGVGCRGEGDDGGDVRDSRTAYWFVRLILFAKGPVEVMGGVLSSEYGSKMGAGQPPVYIHMHTLDSVIKCPICA